MPQNTEFIEELTHKFNTGTITAEELQTLRNWYNSHDDEHVVVETVHQESSTKVKSRMLKGLLTQISEGEARTTSRLNVKWLAAAVAAIAIISGIWISRSKNTDTPKQAVAKTTIEPGGNKATLTLADGRQIELSTEQDGIVSGEKITYANGMPVETVPLTEAAVDKKLVLHTPRGGTYRVTLPDGTQVWLNAASTLRYPLQFAANERVVELEGEAYFHVKPAYGSEGDKLPFKVLSKGQQLEVLGTQFNMTAYPEQKAVKTTLVEGRVAVNDEKNRVILRPNQQAVTTAGTTRVKDVNADAYTAWREGKFSFDGKSFEEMMNEIARWYDLKVVYEEGVPQEELVGDAFRNQNISLVLRLMDVAQIDYQLDVSRRILTIKGKKRM